jgi:hypothetical protein
VDRQHVRLAAGGLLASSKVQDEILAVADNHIGYLVPHLDTCQASA